MITYVRSLVRSVRRLPAPADARPAGRLDYAFAVTVGVVAVIEVVLLRPEISLRWWSLGAFLVWLPTLLARRTNPGLMVLTFAAVNLVLLVVAGTTDGAPPGDLNTAVVALLIPYSLARWGSGRVALIGLGIFTTIAGASLVLQYLEPADRIGGASVVVAAAAIGAALRTRSMLRSRQLDDVRQLERERLARDLHDTVAHHLTAIAITAQAGLAVSETRPEMAREALKRIDEEAGRTLAETRTVLRMLRTEDAPVPERPLDDLAGLNSPGGTGPAVEVELDDGLDLSPTVAAAVHRIAQEAVVNSHRHAQDVTTVRVRVSRRGSDVELTVTDDGRHAVSSDPGFGIVGMTERAALLGGHLEAGPSPEGGWTVTAVLPVEVHR